jgi:hypothetical protein
MPIEPRNEPLGNIGKRVVVLGPHHRQVGGLVVLLSGRERPLSRRLSADEIQITGDSDRVVGLSAGRIPDVGFIPADHVAIHDAIFARRTRFELARVLGACTASVRFGLDALETRAVLSTRPDQA